MRKICNYKFDKFELIESVENIKMFYVLCFMEVFRNISNFFDGRFFGKFIYVKLNKL